MVLASASAVYDEGFRSTGAIQFVGVVDLGVGDEEVHEPTIVREDGQCRNMTEIAHRLLGCLIPEEKEGGVLMTCFLRNPTFRG